MALTLEQHRDALLLLLPRGSAFTRDKNGDIAKVFTGFAEELKRFDERIDALIEESDPRTVIELIDDYENDWGLPTDCTGPLITLAQRRQALVDRIVNIADQSRQTYIDRAADLGFVVTVTEYSAGDSVPGHAEIPAADAAFVVQINAGLEGFQRRVFGGPHGEPYSVFGNALLECGINQIAMTHHVIIFSYT